MADSEHFNDGFESPHLPARPFVLITCGVIAFLTVSLALLWTAYTIGVPDRTVAAAFRPPPPRLEGHPARELQERRLIEHTRLNAAGPGEIPIDKAMAIIAARGAKAYAPIEQSGSLP